MGQAWCVNAPAVDARGDVYASSEDGVYQTGQGGVMKTQTFVNQAAGGRRGVHTGLARPRRPRARAEQRRAHGAGSPTHSCGRARPSIEDGSALSSLRTVM